MGISCDLEKYSSIQDQFESNTLLVGLEPNSNLNELNALLQCLSHIEPLVNYITIINDCYLKFLSL